MKLKIGVYKLLRVVYDLTMIHTTAEEFYYVKFAEYNTKNFGVWYYETW